MLKGGFYLAVTRYKYNNMICYIVIAKVSYPDKSIQKKKPAFNLNSINKQYRGKEKTAISNFKILPARICQNKANQCFVLEMNAYLNKSRPGKL